MHGIVFSSQTEAHPFLKHYKRGRFEGLSEGEWAHDDDLLVGITGVGKIKATLRTERLLRAHRPERLTHMGTCTALNPDIEIGTLLGVAQVFEGDRIELAAPTYPRMPLEVVDKDLQTAVLVTQDHTVRNAEDANYWQRIADASDMEGYAIAYIAALHGVSCQVVKAVVSRVRQEDAQFRKTHARVCEQMGQYLSAHLT